MPSKHISSGKSVHTIDSHEFDHLRKHNVNHYGESPLKVGTVFFGPVNRTFPFGNYDLSFQSERYIFNNALSVEIVSTVNDNTFRFGTLSTNIVDAPIIPKRNQFYFKNYSENQLIAEWIDSMGDDCPFIKDVFDQYDRKIEVQSGYVIFPLWEIKPEIMEKFFKG